MAGQLVAIQAFDSNGVPAAGAKFYTYAAGTTTPKAAYSDEAGTIALSNPVVCNAAGIAACYLKSGIGDYKIALKDSTGAVFLFRTIDNYSPDTDSILYIIGSDIETARTEALDAAEAAQLAQSLAETAQAAAEAAQLAAENAETGAQSAQAAAEAAEAGVAASAAAAAASATAAQTARTAAELAETNAETAETNAETAETNAETAQALAEAAAAATEGSAATAAASATAAAASATAADASADSALAYAALSAESAGVAAQSIFGTIVIVKSRTTTAQPGSPANLDTYIIPSGATGAAWSTYNQHDIARYYTDGAAWVRITPIEGALAYCQDTNEAARFDGSSWADDSAALTTLEGGALPSGVIASQAQAEAGVENTKGMTPLRVAQAIAVLSPAPTIASQAEAEAGADNTKFMTPLRTAQAIDAQTPTLASQAEAEAGSENTKIMTALRVSQAIDALQFLSFIDPASPEYGAVAGAGSDQTSIIQQAINDAITNNKALYLGQEYRVDSGLTIAGTAGSEVGFRIFGPGGLLVNHTGVAITVGSTTGAITRDYQFADIVLRRQTASVPTARPILLNNVSDVHFDGVKVLDFNGFAQIGRTGTADDAIRIFFDRCRFQLIDGDDSTLSGFLVGGSSIVNFTDCFFNGSAVTGQTVGARELIDQTSSTVNCDGFTMQGCTAEQWAKAFKCDGDAGFSNFRISDNIFDRFGSFAIQLQNATSATKRISISNNVFQGVEGDSERAIFISQSSLSLGSEVTITGNHFFDMEEEGVWLNNLYSVNVDDNTFLNCGRNSANEILIANCNTVSLGDNPIRAGTGSGLGVSITGSAGVSVPNFISNDSGATAGPNLTLRRLSGSPAASDIGGEVQFNFNNSTPAEITGAKLSPVISDATAASEDINLEFHTRVAGTLASRMKLGNGLMLGTASDPGAGGLGTTGPIICYGGGQFYSTDAGAGDGPDVYLIRDSASPAANDKGGRFIWTYRNSSASLFTGCTLESRLIDATAGSMDTAFDIGTVVAGSFDTRLKIAQGVVVGNPTGGDKGVGTLNATGVYDDNTLLTDLVLDLAVDGSFDAEKYASHPVAQDLSEDWFSPDWYADHWRTHRRLPGMISWDDPKDQPSTGELVTRLTAVVEAQAVLIEDLNQRLKALENMAAE